MSIIEKGAVYIVATPIGNLDDITFRAVEVLKNAHFVLAEDTRVTKKLFDRYEIRSQLVSYRDQNHSRIIEKILEKIELGLTLALVSDAGTPTISDPGFRLVQELMVRGIKVIPIPGATAVTSALAVSGLPTDSFLFLGFLPKSENKRLELLKRYGALESTIIIFESPNRVSKLLNEILSTLGDRAVSLAQNLTKLSERVVTDHVQNLVDESEVWSEVKGEFVVSIAKEGFRFQRVSGS